MERLIHKTGSLFKKALNKVEIRRNNPGIIIFSRETQISLNSNKLTIPKLV